MTAPGPWDADAMWVPEEDEVPRKKQETRTHYFIVGVTVSPDGSHDFSIESELRLDPDEPVYYPDREEWGRLDSPTLRDSDSNFELELRDRLGINR
jgi:hypothetical protein